MSEHPDLVWDQWNTDHINKHKVTVKEVEELYFSEYIKKETYKKRLKLLGETTSGRYLTVIISFEKQKQPYVVSARDMSKKERKIYDL